MALEPHLSRKRTFWLDWAISLVDKPSDVCYHG